MYIDHTSITNQMYTHDNYKLLQLKFNHAIKMSSSQRENVTAHPTNNIIHFSLSLHDFKTCH